MESPRAYSQALCDGPPIGLAPGLYQLTLPLPFRLNHVHVYLVEADDGFLLIDTGVNPSAFFSSLKRKLGEIGLDFQAITRVVITHLHHDHCG
jgi:glyoxylase-like metal-dependent hydrolase (beta-lactamase superfamily II)